jgi:hypothetical protein
MIGRAFKAAAAIAAAFVITAGLLAWLASPGSGGEERPAASGEAKKPPPEPADNSYCFVCHANYEQEKLTKGHQRAGVGCENCHGQSVKHSGDEDGLTPPDKMYARSQVTEFCITCHEKGTLLKRDEHKDFFRELQAESTCDDCHGEKHRMAVRTRIWDKKTGKLVKDDGVRMMLKNSPATEGATQKSK